MGDIEPTGLTMFGCESISSSQSRTSNITGNNIKLEAQGEGSYQTPLNAENSGSIPLSNILKNTALLRRGDFHLSTDNPFLQVDSRPPPGTVFTSEDLCTGRKRRRGNNKDKENIRPQSIRNNKAARVNKKNLESPYRGSYQTPYNVKNSVSGSYSVSHSIPPSTGVFSSSGSTPLSNILKNTALLRRTYFHLSPDNPFLKVDSRPPPETVFTSEDLCTGRRANKDKENTPSQPIKYNKATMNERSLTQKPRPQRVNGLVNINQLPTRIPLSNISNVDVSRGLPQKRGKLKKTDFLAEITRTLFEETEVCNGEDRDYESSDQSRIAKFDSNNKTSSSAGRGTRVAVKPEYCVTPLGSITNPAVQEYIVSGLSREAVPTAVANSGDDSAKFAKAKEFANDYDLSSETGFSSNSVAEALLMHYDDPDKV